MSKGQAMSPLKAVKSRGIDMSEKRLHVLELTEHRRNERAKDAVWENGYQQAIVGCITAVTADGSIWIDFEDNPDQPLCAMTVAEITAQDIGRNVLIVFERGDRRRPIIVGCLFAKAAEPQKSAMEVIVTRESADEIRVDGRQIVFEAEQELILKCGQGSIIVKKDGSIVIKGTKIVSRSRGVNKIKGASVRIN